MLDLDITYSVDGENNLHKVDHRKEILMSAISGVKNYMSGNKRGAMNDAKKAVKSFFAMQKESKEPKQPMNPEDRSSAKNPTRATVVQFAGCHDTQVFT